MGEPYRRLAYCRKDKRICSSRKHIPDSPAVLSVALLLYRLREWNSSKRVLMSLDNNASVKLLDDWLHNDSSVTSSKLFSPLIQ